MTPEFTDERGGAVDESRTDTDAAKHRPQPVPESVPPEDAFRTIGNETRLAILDTLWMTKRGEPMGFAELRTAVGMRDGSQFNYHLQKLVEGGFVERVDGGYTIRHAGAEVVWAVRSGSFTDHPEIEPFEAGGRCYECDAPLHARYADEMFFVECSACGLTHTLGIFPPGALAGRTPEEALLAYEQVRRAVRSLVAVGICSVCHGPMGRTVARGWAEAPVQPPYFDPDRELSLMSWYVCDNCGVWVYVTPGEAVIDHPVVVALYREHGIDVRTLPRWELPWVVDESAVEVVSDDPLRVRVTVAVEGDELVLTLDEAFDVLAVG
jgi:DNA-binding transcriptional ArsR family regulator